jgi:hypothetical protein
MLKIEYQLSQSFNRYPDGYDFSIIDENSLCFNSFFGDALLSNSNQIISMAWGWIPLVDFSIVLKAIQNELSSRKTISSLYEFTESEAFLKFERTGACVSITSNFSQTILQTNMDDFGLAVSTFRNKLSCELCMKYPSLQKNIVFNNFFPEKTK